MAAAAVAATEDGLFDATVSSVSKSNQTESNQIEPNRTEPNRFGSFLVSGTMFFGFLIKFYARFTIQELKRTVLDSIGAKS